MCFGVCGSIWFFTCFKPKFTFPQISILPKSYRKVTESYREVKILINVYSHKNGWRLVVTHDVCPHTTFFFFIENKWHTVVVHRWIAGHQSKICLPHPFFAAQNATVRLFLRANATFYFWIAFQKFATCARVLRTTRRLGLRLGFVRRSRLGFVRRSRLGFVRRSAWRTRILLCKKRINKWSPASTTPHNQKGRHKKAK